MQETLNRPPPEPETTEPPPEKIPKVETTPIIKHFYQNEKVVWMGKRVPLQQAIDELFDNVTLIRRLSVANMQSILRNVFDKKLVEKLEKLPLKDILKIWETSPEKFLKMHTINIINWVHDYERLLRLQEQYKDNPENLKEIEKEKEDNKEAKEPIEKTDEEETEEKGDPDAKASSCGGFLGWLKCALEELGTFLAGVAAGIAAGFKAVVNIPSTPNTPSLPSGSTIEPPDSDGDEKSDKKDDKDDDKVKMSRDEVIEEIKIFKGELITYADTEIIWHLQINNQTQRIDGLYKNSQMF